MTSAFFQRTRQGVAEEVERRVEGEGKGDREETWAPFVCAADVRPLSMICQKKKRKEQNPLVKKNRRLLPVGRQIDECIRLNERKKGSCPVERRTAFSNRCFDQMT